MSNATFTGPELVSLISTGLPQNYCCISAAALLLYENAITLSDEIEGIWKRKKSAVTVLFVANRILAALNAISLVVVVPFWTTLISCEATSIFQVIPVILLWVVGSAFSALRVYAIGGRAWRTALLVGVLSIVPFPVDIYLNVRSSFSIVPVSKYITICSQQEAIPQTTGSIFEIVERVCSILADACVLFVICKNTRYTLRGDNATSLLSTLLLRDGFLYFVCLAALNVAQLVVSVAMNGNSYVYSLLSALSAIFVSRFLLNLRQADDSDGGRAADSRDPSSLAVGSEVSSVRFLASFVGSMGAPLDGGFGMERAASDGRGVDDADSEEGFHLEDEGQLGRGEAGRAEQTAVNLE